MAAILVTPQALGADPERVRRELSGHELDFSGAQINDPAELLRRLKDKDGAILGVEKITREVIAACPRLKVLSRFGVGYDSIDTAAAKERGIRVAISAGALPAINEAVARHAMALLLALSHNLKHAAESLAAGRWERRQNAALRGAVFGVAGLGGIGAAAARLAEAFGMKVAYWGRAEKPAAKAKGWTFHADLDALIAASDVVSLHLPAMPGCLFDAARIERLSGRWLLNTARGGLLDEEALIAALRAGKLKGAGLDVFRHEPLKDSSLKLAALPNVVATPHLASNDATALAAMGASAVSNVRCFLSGETAAVDRFVA